MLLTFTGRFSILLTHYAGLLWLRTFGARQLLMEGSDPFKTRLSFILHGPSTEQNIGFLSYINIYCIVSGQNTKSLQEWLIGKSLLES